MLPAHFQLLGRLRCGVLGLNASYALEDALCAGRADAATRPHAPAQGAWHQQRSIGLHKADQFTPFAAALGFDLGNHALHKRIPFATAPTAARAAGQTAHGVKRQARAHAEREQAGDVLLSHRRARAGARQWQGNASLWFEIGLLRCVECCLKNESRGSSFFDETGCCA
jgi:hypothetical protein